MIEVGLPVVLHTLSCARCKEETQIPNSATLAHQIQRGYVKLEVEDGVLHVYSTSFDYEKTGKFQLYSLSLKGGYEMTGKDGVKHEYLLCGDCYSYAMDLLASEIGPSKILDDQY